MICCGRRAISVLTPLVAVLLASACLVGHSLSSPSGQATGAPDQLRRLPVALVIGDSISLGYTPFVRKILDGRVEVVHAPGNNAGTTLSRAKIDQWLGERSFDVIHFNWGLHDLKRVQRSNRAKNSNDPDDPRQANLEQYEANLRFLVERLEATGASLIFATTTPFPAGVKPHRDPEDVTRYNEVAVGIMQEHGIAVDDLCARVQPWLEELQQPVNVHFTKAGSEFMARHVAQAILDHVPAARANQRSFDRPPNILLIVVDDLGYGDLGCYGQQQIQTPSIDRLAAEGLLFTQFYAGSTVCAPSRCSLMTGLHTGHCRIRGNAKQNLEPDDVTLAEVMKGAGYRTALVGKWGIGHEGSDGVPTRQGFDSFFGYLDQTHAHNYYPSFLLRNEERVPLPNVVPNEGKVGQGMASEKKAYSHDLFVEEALSFLEQKREQPFFLYLALTIPHANNEAGKAGMEVPELGEFAARDWPEPEKGFAAMLTRLDRDVGRIRAKLDQLGIAQETLVLFSSDNGPHSEGGHRAETFDSNGPLSGKKRDLLEGGIRVPTIARWPGQIAPGSRTDHQAAFWDVMPTFAELGGADAVLPEEIDGITFLPTLLGNQEAQAQHEELYWAFYERGSGRALRRGQWKLIEQPLHSPLRLYDVASDPGEEHDLATEHPDLVLELAERMERADAPSETWKFPAKKPQR